MLIMHHHHHPRNPNTMNDQPVFVEDVPSRSMHTSSANKERDIYSGYYPVWPWCKESRKCINEVPSFEHHFLWGARFILNLLRAVFYLAHCLLVCLETLHLHHMRTDGYRGVISVSVSNWWPESPPTLRARPWSWDCCIPTNTHVYTGYGGIWTCK